MDFQGEIRDRRNGVYTWKVLENVKNTWTGVR